MAASSASRIAHGSWQNNFMTCRRITPFSCRAERLAAALLPHCAGDRWQLRIGVGRRGKSGNVGVAARCHRLPAWRGVFCVRLRPRLARQRARVRDRRRRAPRNLASRRQSGHHGLLIMPRRVIGERGRPRAQALRMAGAYGEAVMKRVSSA